MTTFWIIFLTILASVFMGLFAASQMNLTLEREESRTLRERINRLQDLIVSPADGQVDTREMVAPPDHLFNGDGHILFNTEGETLTPLNIPNWGMIEIDRDELYSAGENHWKYAYLTAVLKARQEMFPNEKVTLYTERDVLRPYHRISWDIRPVNQEGPTRD